MKNIAGGYDKKKEIAISFNLSVARFFSHHFLPTN
jgi:hypothetical protein